jgi:subtilisin family serine protease
MRARGLVWVVLAVFLVSMAAPAAAADGDKIVRTRPGLLGIDVIGTVCNLLGCEVVQPLDTPPGDIQNSALFLVRGLLNDVVNLLLSVLGVIAIEPDLPAAVMQAPWTGGQASAAVVNALDRRDPMNYHGTVVWEGYLDQAAGGVIGVGPAHCGYGLTGTGTVAVIDTGVDLDHPALQAVLTPGYDFTNNTDGGGESGVGQASAAVVNAVWVNGSTIVVIDQASAAVVNDPAHRGVGHGTMVAGAVHFVAPGAQIMPLRAFGADGTGHTSNILRAIYYAVRNGATVLNLSFSRDTPSPELKRALTHAKQNGVVAVASAGNDGDTELVYPAALNTVISVASTSNGDRRSLFSNYGSELVDLAAPGEGIITPYPGGTYAGAYGTSFAAPLVAGTVALLHEIHPELTPDQVRLAIENAKRLPREDVNKGRLDLRRALATGLLLWPFADLPEPVASCTSEGVDWTPAQ